MEQSETDGLSPRLLGQSNQAPAAFEIVALAASAGGIRALVEFLAALPASFPAAIVVVQHLYRHHRSLLPQILEHHTVLKVKHADTSDRLLAGFVYVAPPNQHLLVGIDRRLLLTDSALVNFVRPSADCLFESVAQIYGQRAIAVVLTGTGRDGAAGIQAIKQKGGITIAQDQATAEYFGMPDAAIHTQAIDYVLPLNAIAPLVMELVTRQAGSIGATV